MRAIRWMFAEAISILGLQLVRVARHATTMDRKVFTELATDRLSSGTIPTHALRAISERVDVYVGKLLAGLNASPEIRTAALGALSPTPPDYIEPLLELVFRLAGLPAQTAQLPRQLDAIVFERLVRRRELDVRVLRRLDIGPVCERQVRTIGAFLRGQVGTPEMVDRAMQSHLARSDNTNGDSVQQDLFSEQGQ
jgi:hypothetical protein